MGESPNGKSRPLKTPQLQLNPDGQLVQLTGWLAGWLPSGFDWSRGGQNSIQISPELRHAFYFGFEKVLSPARFLWKNGSAKSYNSPIISMVSYPGFCQARGCNALAILNGEALNRIARWDAYTQPH